MDNNNNNNKEREKRSNMLHTISIKKKNAWDRTAKKGISLSLLTKLIKISRLEIC